MPFWNRFSICTTSVLGAHADLCSLLQCTHSTTTVLWHNICQKCTLGLGLGPRRPPSMRYLDLPQVGINCAIVLLVC